MPKTLRIAFTGSALLTPEYPDGLAPLPGPLFGILPGARRMRRSTFPTDQIDAQFAFLEFDFRHLLAEQDDDRGADYKHPDTRDPKKGLCFLEEEVVFVETQPLETLLTFDPGPLIGFPVIGTSGVRWVARWRDFAAGGDAALKPGVLSDEGEFVRVIVPAGHVSAGFVHEPIYRLNFDYGEFAETRPYAQEVVITLTYPDHVPFVTLKTIPFGNGSVQPSLLRFAWFDKQQISLRFGNGSLASIQNLLASSFVGHDHEGDYDIEFEVTYDVVDCRPDLGNRMPLPRIVSTEILRVPCAASMVAPPPSQVAEATTTVAATKDVRAEPRAARRKP